MRSNLSLLGIFFFVLALISETYSSPFPPLSPARNVLSTNLGPTKSPFKNLDARAGVHATTTIHTAGRRSSPHSLKSPAKRQTPTLPTVAECKVQLKVDKDTSLFYSGPSGYARKAKQWRAADPSRNKYKILGEMWVDKSYPDKWANDEEASKKFFDICSQAMAEKSSGTVYVLLPSDTKGTDWHKGTVWDNYEWPNLGAAVTKVIRVNPDNSNEETIKGGASASSSSRAGRFPKTRSRRQLQRFV